MTSSHVAVVWIAWTAIACAPAPTVRVVSSEAPTAPSPTDPCDAPPTTGAPMAVRPVPTVSPKLPTVPSLALMPTKDGEAFTVWGAWYGLRNPWTAKEVERTMIDVVGWVVATNFDDAPQCAVHPAGRADPAGCRAPIPEFTIADEPTATVARIRVLGFASNWAQLYSAREHNKAADPDAEGRLDDYWGQEIPNPLPNVGARVRVEGTFGRTFTRSPIGVENDPNGILTYESIEYLEPPPSVPTFGGR